MIDLLLADSNIYGLKQEDILPLDNFNIFYGWTGIVQISGVFLSLSFKTNALPGRGLHNSKQYRFCQHMPLQSTQNESPSERL